MKRPSPPQPHWWRWTLGKVGKPYGHLPPGVLGKILNDLEEHTVLKEGARTWDDEKFNPLNDYQRHLYALFLRASGVAYTSVWAQIYVLCTDVGRRQKDQYVNEVLHSTIVGFTLKDGSLIPLPQQAEAYEPVGDEVQHGNG